MSPLLLAALLLAEPPAPSAEAAPQAAPAAPARPDHEIALPPPPSLGSPFAPTPSAPATPFEQPPPEVVALLAKGRTLADARAVDLDGDRIPEWILVARYLHPDRLDYGPRSSQWRAGQRIESRATHELVIAGKVGGAWKVRFQAELRGNEKQALFVEPLLGSTRAKGKFPVVITGARACAGTCGPLEVHLVVWDPRTKALGDYAYAGAEFVVLAQDGSAEIWFADRRPGDPMCCPSGYTVMRAGMYGFEIDALSQKTVPADNMKKLLPPGGLIYRAEK
jgi:hypothetical protein